MHKCLFILHAYFFACYACYLFCIGGGNLVITGSGFGSSGATVNLGDAECEVLSQSNTQINCSLPPNEPGDYDIEVSVVDRGYADTR